MIETPIPPLARSVEAESFCEEGDVIASTKLDIDATWGLEALRGKVPALPPNPPDDASPAVPGWKRTPRLARGLSVDVVSLFFTIPSMEEVSLTLRRCPRRMFCGGAGIEGLVMGALLRDAASNSAEVIDMANRSPADGGVMPAGNVLDLAK